MRAENKNRTENRSARQRMHPSLSLAGFNKECSRSCANLREHHFVTFGVLVFCPDRAERVGWFSPGFSALPE